MDGKNAVNALGVVNIGGVFVVLLVGLAFAVMVAIAEFCWKTSALNSKENLVQTSPLRRNSRKFTSIERRRSRKSLCAEIARTLVPRLMFCDSYEASSGLSEAGSASLNDRTGSAYHHHQASANNEQDLCEFQACYLPASAATSNLEL